MMAELNLDLLTAEEKQKLFNISQMIKRGRPDFVEETQDVEEQIKFIRKHGATNYRFYTNEWYKANDKRRKAIYYRVRKEYVKNYRIQGKIMNDAIESAKNLLVKAIQEKVPVK